MKVKLDLIIEYEDEDGDALPASYFPHVHEVLCDAAEHLYDNGLLSKSSEAHVSLYTYRIVLEDED